MIIIYIEDELKRIDDILDGIIKGKNIEYIDLEQIEDDKLKQIYKKINTINSNIEELTSYSCALSGGNLDVESPPRDNFFVGGLKELHSNLLHLTWKVNQISGGDYDQKVDFMGDFSDAFNDMVSKLKKRDFQLSESRNVIETLFSHTSMLIFIIDAETNELLYCKEKNQNISIEKERTKARNNIIQKLNKKTKKTSERAFDWDLFSEVDGKWYNVKSMMMTWVNNNEVYFHMLFDISDKKSIQAQLENAILKDPKTGIFNINYAINYITDLFDKSDLFCVCFFDLDNLKLINDTHGHIEGDKLIDIFTKIVDKEIRADDSFCRIGGDEFLLITPYSSEDATTSIVRRIQKSVEDLNSSDTEKFKISFSYGIECSENVPDKTPKAIIDMADKKMYSHKRTKK